MKETGKVWTLPLLEGDTDQNLFSNICLKDLETGVEMFVREVI